MTDTQELAQRLTNSEALWAAIKDAELDVRLAEREGKGVDDAKAKVASATTDWHQNHLRCAELAKAFAEEHGMPPRLLGKALDR